MVAGEVRTLAQRSATAARQIATLINDSVSRTNAGSDLVGKAGHAMSDIVKQVTQVVPCKKIVYDCVPTVETRTVTCCKMVPHTYTVNVPVRCGCAAPVHTCSSCGKGIQLNCDIYRDLGCRRKISFLLRTKTSLEEISCMLLTDEKDDAGRKESSDLDCSS